MAKTSSNTLTTYEVTTKEVITYTVLARDEQDAARRARAGQGEPIGWTEPEVLDVRQR